VAAAAAAFPAWSAATALERSTVLRAIAALMMAHQDRLAALCTAECGKPLAESRTEVAYAASFLDGLRKRGGECLARTVPANDRASACLLRERRRSGRHHAMEFSGWHW